MKEVSQLILLRNEVEHQRRYIEFLHAELQRHHDALERIQEEGLKAAPGPLDSAAVRALVRLAQHVIWTCGCLARREAA